MLHCEVHEGEGPYLLLVHGMLSSRAQWTPNLAGFARVARPVVVELLGHGRSPSPEDAARYHPDAYVDAFEALRVELGASRWALCGQSFGACFTLRYALRYPERVIAQVFTNSTSALAPPEWTARVNADCEATAARIDAEGMAAIERMPFHPNNAKSLPPDAHAELLQDAELLNPIGISRTLRYTVPVSTLHGAVAKTAVPTLLVCGERERRFESFRRYAEAEIPRLETLALDAAHAVNIEAPQAFEAGVTEFLARRGAGGP